MDSNAILVNGANVLTEPEGLVRERVDIAADELTGPQMSADALTGAVV